MADLTELLRKSAAQVAAMSDAERETMIARQRESWVRGMTARCEHGEVDFEQCPKCRENAAARLAEAQKDGG